MKRPSITTAVDESGATRARAAGFVGRVGVLAVALGIGAVLGGPVIATADTGNTGTEDASADSPAQPPRGRAAGSGRTSTAPTGDTGTGSRRPAGSTTERGSRPSTAGDPAVPAAVPHNDTIGPAAAKVAVRPVIVQPSQADSSPSSSSPSSAALRAPVEIPAPVARPRAAATIPVVTASALRSVVATVTAPVAAPVAAATPAPAASVAPVIGVLGAILAPLSGTGTGAPAESPASWLVAAATRRLGRPVARRPLAAQVTVAPAAAVAGAATATATGTTTTVTWAWGTNPVLNFNPATDKLDFGWMPPSAFTVAETAGSTQIAIVDNNHAYTLKNVPLSQLTIANIVAKDTGTVAKWQTLITNAQSVVTPTVSVANATVAEGNSGTTGAAFTVALSKASTKTVTVGYATANGTATAGTDYTAKTGTLTFAPGVTTQTVTVAVTGDATVEPTEAFTVTLTNPVGATLGTATATGTITNDDVAVVTPTVSVANATVAEGNSGTTGAAFTVALSKASTKTVTVGYSTANGTATAGTDYTAKTGTLTFAPGVTTQTVTVAVTGDATVEPTEAFTVTLTNPVGATLGTATATGTITNDDTAVTPPKVSIADLTMTEGNGEHAHLMFTATLDKASATTVSVGYATANGTATAGVDYTAAAGSISFAPGVTTQQIHVDILGDTTAEPDETFAVTLSNPSGVSIARATAIGSILNDDLAGPTPPTTGANYVDIMTYGMFHGNDHSGMDALEGGRTAITTEAVVAYNDLRRFAGLAPTTIENVGRWAFANGLTNNAQAWGNDLQGVGLYYAMQGAKVGWIADAKYTPQIVADIERAARLGSANEVMAMVAQYGHAGYAKYLTDNGYQTAFINTLKMEPHYGGWMHDRVHGGLAIDGAATAHDVNHLTVLSHDQTQPFMNDTWDYPQWPALDVPNTKVIEYFQSMVTLGNPLGDNSTSAGSSSGAVSL